MSGDLRVLDNHYSEELDMLRAISKSTQKTAMKNYGRAQSYPLGAIALIFICVHAGLLTLAAFGFAPTLIDNTDIVNNVEWYVKGAVAGGVAACVWLFLILNIFRKTSWVCWVFVDFVLCGIIGFVLSAVFIVRDLNIDLPQPLPQIHQQPVVKKYCQLKCKKSCGRRCTRRSNYPIPSEEGCSPQSRAEFMQLKRQQDNICAYNAWYVYNLEIQSWHRDEGNYAFLPKVTVFDSTHVNGYMNVPVHDGALGLEWVDTNQIQAR